MKIVYPVVAQLYALLISRGAILNIKFVTSFAESNHLGLISLRWILVFSSGALGIL